jgi:hypothetical protein
MKYSKLSLIFIVLLVFLSPIGGESEQANLSDEFTKHKTLAGEGDAEAEFKLAEYYRHGIYVSKDNAKEAELYEKAASQGHIRAQAALANCYALGIGVSRNPKKAVFWWEKAAVQGYPDSQYFLGRAYYDGEGVIKNYVEAAKWVTSAAQNGSAFGRGFLGILHMEGKGVTKDNIKAYAWLNMVSDWRMYKEHRDELETKMSQEEIKQAQNLSQKLLKQFGKTIE